MVNNELGIACLWIVVTLIVLSIKFLIVNRLLLQQKIIGKRLWIDSLFYFLGTSSLIILSLLGGKEMQSQELFAFGGIFMVFVYPILLIIFRYYLYKINNIQHNPQYDWGVWYIGIILFLVLQFGIPFILISLFHKLGFLI